MNREKYFEYQNNYNKEKYDRIGLMIPKGKKEIWKQKANELELSLNQLIIKAVEEYIKSDV